MAAAETVKIPRTDMPRRPIGGSGMSASIIGLGAEHLDFKPYSEVEPVISAAIENGINIMDLFMPGQEVRQNIGRALAGRRDKMLIQGHIGSTNINEQYDKSRDRAVVKKYFEDLLRCLDTDYIDIGMLFFVDSQRDYEDVFYGDSLEYALELKKQGVIRAVGVSSHNPVTARNMVESGCIDVLMFSINPSFDMTPAHLDVLDYHQGKGIDYEMKLDPDRAALYRLCEQRGTAITVMKTLGGGKLISPQHTPFARPLSVTQCIHYALTRPAVVSAMLGFASVQQLQESLRYLDADEHERDYSAAIQEYQGSLKGSCMYCSHCLPCPQNINIAAVHKYLDIALVDPDNVPPSAAAHYRELEQRASQCTACGGCESRCPFSVPVAHNMKKAAELFGV